MKHNAAINLKKVCNAYENFHNNNPPLPSHYLKQMLGLILKENSFEFKGENYLQTHGTAMGTKMAVALANIFMAEIETNLLNQSRIKPMAWNIISMTFFPNWDTKREDLDIFIAQANKYHPTIKLRRSQTPKWLFLTQWFTKEQVSTQNRSLTSKLTINKTETFQYIHYTSCQPPDVKRGFIKGEAIRLLRTNSSETHFQNATESSRLS